MKHYLFILSFFVASFSVQGQIFNTTADGSGPTNYTTASFVDSIYYYCTPISGAELTAIPSSGVPNWNFAWQQYDVATNSWIAYSTTNNATSSTISNLSPGGYRVTITDATSAIIGCYRAWIVEILSPTTVNVDPIPPGCGAVQLNGQINWGSATPYYEPPAEPLIIDANTEITVCFSANHTYVSDLGFYLVGPTTCGSPTISLAPNPGSIVPGNNTCNAGNNLSNLCFTTETAANFNVCTAAVPLTGTFSSYGPSPTPINWSALYGCDASQPGWRVQIYDCVGLDVGALTYATITITGVTLCGDTITITYDSGNINSAINDNSCSAATASIFTVPPTPATAVAYNTNFIWTAVPNIAIPNATTSLTPLVSPGPTQNTTFTLSIDTAAGPGCIPGVCGGNWQDSELYVYTPPTPASLSGPPTVCTGDGPVNYTASVSGGTWSGTGITNATNGTFDPTSLNPGNYTISYTVSNPCPINSFITISVVNGTSTAQITNPGVQCFNGSPINLSATPSGGTWSGTGITDAVNGTFDPSVTGVGNFQIDYQASGTCPASGSITIFVDTIQDASFTVPGNICVSSSAFNLTGTTPGGTWSGTGITDAVNGTFDPSVSQAGTFAITYTVGANCPNSSTTNITVTPLPAVDAGANVGICPGDSTQLNATGANSYVWTPGSTLSDSTIVNPYASPLVQTTYYVTGTDANGCMATDSVVVSIFTPGVLSINGNNQICEGDSTLLNATGATNVVWAPANVVGSPNSNTTYVNPSTTTLISVVGEDPNGCMTSNTINIVVNTVDASMIATPTSGVTPLVVDFMNNSTNGVLYIWDFGDGNVDTTSSLTNPQYTYSNEGTYVVTLTVISAAGCMDQTSVTIVVIPACQLAVPNVFSPNNDLINDQLELICSELLETMNMKIYDRWGRQVAELTDPNQKWSGEGQSEGTFYYVLTGVGVNSTVYNLNGYITLTR